MPGLKTEICSKTEVLVSVHWIKEVEIAKTIDELMTSQSITGRRDFSNYDMLDAKIASALRKIITSVHFRRRVSVEQQRAQKDDRFLRGVQDFDTKWDQVLLAASEIPTTHSCEEGRLPA